MKFIPIKSATLMLLHNPYFLADHSADIPENQGITHAFNTLDSLFPPLFTPFEDSDNTVFTFPSDITLPDLPDHPGLPDLPPQASGTDLPELPGLPEPPPQAGDFSLPDLPTHPGLPELPSQSSGPGLPDLPDHPGLPDLPPQASGTDLPELPGLPEPPPQAGDFSLPDLPTHPGLPELPSQSSGPGLPDLPDHPGLPDLPPQASGLSSSDLPELPQPHNTQLEGEVYTTGSHHRPGHSKKGGGGDVEPPSTPGIDLFTVVLHEIGHALGLGHSDPNDGIEAVMDAFYSGPVAGLFAQDIQNVQAFYPESGVGTQGWLDLTGDGIIEITYSFIPDKTHMEKGLSKLESTLNDAFGSDAVWKPIFENALSAWENALALDDADDGDNQSNINFNFTEVHDAGLPFNYSGESQDDPDSGDIRFGMHPFDGAGGILAHGYYPPPNGLTAAGDIHLDSSENWQDMQTELSLDLEALWL